MAAKTKLVFRTVDEYIALQPESIQKALQQIRKTVRKAAPNAEEVISYQMPAYKQNGMVAWFAVSQNHFGLYVIPEVLQEFRNKLTSFKTSKSAVQFPMDKPIPFELIAEIVKCAVDVNLAKKMLKVSTKKKKRN